MAKKARQARSAIPYVQRLAEDDYLQEQLSNAATRLSEAYRRARRKRSRVVEDKKLYANLREAAMSIRKAASRLRPEPEPSHRGRKAAVAALAAGGAAVVVKRRASTEPAPTGSS